MPPAMGKYLFDAKTLPGDLIRSWRADGVNGIVDQLRQRSLDRIAVRSHSLVIETELHDVRQIPPPKGVSICRFKGEWTVLGDLVSQRMTPYLSSAARAGRWCLVARRGGEPVGIAWLAPKMDIRFDKFTLPLPADAVYLWMVQVVRTERTNYLGRALASAALGWAQEVGWRRAWMIINPENRVSLRAAANVMPSSRVLGSVTRTKLFTRMHSEYDSLPVPLPLSQALAR
jgi:GNAT superfamily N-acetyltransferase